VASSRHRFRGNGWLVPDTVQGEEKITKKKLIKQKIIKKTNKTENHKKN
jgi:hypothetical protein